MTEEIQETGVRFQESGFRFLESGSIFLSPDSCSSLCYLCVSSEAGGRKALVFFRLRKEERSAHETQR